MQHRAIQTSEDESSFPTQPCTGCTENRIPFGVLLALLAALTLSLTLGGPGALVPRGVIGSIESAPEQVASPTALAPPESVDVSESRKTQLAVDASAPSRRGRPFVDPERLAAQLAVYHEVEPKSILELQPFRFESSMEIEGVSGRRGRASLVNLNPEVNAWYLLRLRWQDEAKDRTFHLENRDPHGRDLLVDRHFAGGLIVAEDGRREECPLWSSEAPRRLEAAAAEGRGYVPLCGGAFYLRNEIAGHRTTKEWVAEFLRDNIWLGEELTVFVRTHFFGDAYLSTPKRLYGPHTHPAAGGDRAQTPTSSPVSCQSTQECLKATEIAIRLADGETGGVTVGRWHRAAAGPGIYVAAIQPGLVPPEVVSHPERLSALDEVESHALAYLVAFDLDQFDLKFALGTDHPRVGWSKRAPQEVRDSRLPGPDGIGAIAPLVATGMTAPDLRGAVAATFTAGFKREHGAFKWSELSRVNGGSHYGFIENGVVLSKLQPDLATLVVFTDGSVEIKTWTEQDDARLHEIRYARQNGVPIIERDPATGRGVPGRLVNQWGAGNWSGSLDRRLRALRAGLCLHERGDRSFLIYGYFSSATPSAMARVFQGYNCSYAMHLDMNALEHTYLALYHADASGLKIEHLVEGMEVLDKRLGDTEVPRFVGYADNRDFFYLLRRNGTPTAAG